MPSPRVPTSVLAFGLWGAMVGALIGLAVALYTMARPAWIRGTGSSTKLDITFVADAMLEFAGAGLFLGLFAAPFLGQRAQRRHLRLGLCPRCGYHKACDNCPECGTTDKRWRHCFIDLRTLTSPDTDTDTDTPAPMDALRHKSASQGRPLAYHRIDRQITPLFAVAGVWLAAIFMGDKLLSRTSASLGLVSTVLLWLTLIYLVVISVLGVGAIIRVGRMQRRFGQTPNACLACLHPIPPDTRVCPACDHFDNREDLEPGWKRLCVPGNN